MACRRATLFKAPVNDQLGIVPERVSMLIGCSIDTSSCDRAKSEGEAAHSSHPLPQPASVEVRGSE